MRAIVAELIGKSPVLWLPVAALVLFILVFAAAAVRVVRRGAAAYDRDARLPLENDDA